MNNFFKIFAVSHCLLLCGCDSKQSSQLFDGPDSSEISNEININKTPTNPCVGEYHNVINFTNANWNRGVSRARPALMFRNMDEIFFEDIKSVYIEAIDQTRQIISRKSGENGIQVIYLSDDSFNGVTFEKVCLKTQ